MQTRYILIVSALVATILSAVITLTPIGIYNQAEISAMFQTLIVPAAYAFSIWSIIYLSWFILGIASLFGKIAIKRENILLLAVAQILSTLWLIPSQYLFTGTSLIVILGVLYFLLILFYNSRSESLSFKIVSDTFLGWIIVASLANLHLVLVSYGVYFFPLQLTFISIIGGAALSTYFIVKHNSIAPSLVLIWALIGIIVGQDAYITITTAVFSIFFITGLLAYLGYHNVQTKK